MGEKTGIAWTDSTQNFWEGCTKVGPGCDHCYAEARDNRFTGGEHWGPGAPRRQMSQHTRNNPLRWQRDAPAFLAEHGHPRRVFCSSLADVFDNEVADEWRADAFRTMLATPDLRWQLCTKRVSNVGKMWRTYGMGGWPANVGLLITVVNQAEYDRDVPRLKKLKAEFGIPWVGLSVEPMLAPMTLWEIEGIDWVIVGGESGPQARRFEAWWAVAVLAECTRAGVACFVKQMGDNFTSNNVRTQLVDKGKDISSWPAILQVQQFPKALLA